MAKNKSPKKGRLNEIIVVGFVILAMVLLVVQLSLDVIDTVEQQSSAAATPTATVAPPADAPPAEPTPTYDIGSVPISEMD